MTVPTDLHNKVEALSNDKVAFVFQAVALKTTFLNGFSNSFKMATGKIFPVLGFDTLAIQLTDCSPLPEDFDFDLQLDADGTPIIKFSTDFQITFDLILAATPAVKFSQIVYDVKNLVSKIAVKNAELVLSDSLVYDLHSDVNDYADKELHKTTHGLSDKDILTVEASIAYVLPTKILESFFASLAKLKLKDIFLPFSGMADFDLHVVNALRRLGEADIEQFLVVVSQVDLLFDPQSGCGIDLGLNNPTINFWGMGSNWDIQTPPVVFTRKYADVNGFVSAYMPKRILDERFSKVLPGISYYDNDNGFIGYDIDVTASLTRVGFAIDTQRMCLIVNLGLFIRGNANLTIDAGDCFGRVDLGNIRFYNRSSSLDYVLDFVAFESSKLVIRSSIEKLEISGSEVHVSLASKWAHLGGGEAAIAGFIVDQVISRILAHNIPIEIRHKIEEQAKIYNLKLFDLEKFEKAINVRFDSQVYDEVTGQVLDKNGQPIDHGNVYVRQFNNIAYSSKDNSVLVGLSNNLG